MAAPSPDPAGSTTDTRDRDGEGQRGLASCAAPHAAAEPCWPHLSCKRGNLVVAINYVASPRGCSSGAEPPPQANAKMPPPAHGARSRQMQKLHVPRGLPDAGEILREADELC